MNDVVRKCIDKDLRQYVKLGLEHGFTAEELQRVVEEVRNDVLQNDVRHFGAAADKEYLRRDLQYHHRQMVERRKKGQ